MAVAVAAIKALTGVIKRSTAQTMMGLEKELKDAAAALQRCVLPAHQRASFLVAMFSVLREMKDAAARA